jgi:CheY-like chemotaxis protein
VREQANKEYHELFMARVGLLEDNPVIARLTATMLNYTGHQVTIYEHPRDCLTALSLTNVRSNSPFTRASDADVMLPVELLILDLHLPDIGGFQILELIQSNNHTRSLPLIFCTAATAREIDYALRLAPQAYLIEKPFKMETLLSAVSNILQVQ